MRWRGVVLAMTALLAGCASAGSSPSSASLAGLVVTADGTRLQSAAQSMPTTLGLRVVAAHSLRPSQVAVSLDGKAVTVQSAGGGAVSASVGALPLGSQHALRVHVAGETAFSGEVRVVTATAVMAAVHRDGNDSSLDVDVSFSNPPVRAAVAALLPGATLTWSLGEDVHAVWPLATAPDQLTLPQSLSLQRGSRLSDPLTLSLAPPAAGTLRRITEPPAPQPQVASVLGFAVSTDASHESVQAHVQQLSVLSPTGLEVAANGSLSGVPDSIDVAAAQAAGVAIMPVVANDDDSAAQTHTLVTSPASRSALEAASVTACLAQHFAGINLDIEAIDPADQAAFTALVQGVAEALHAHGLSLTVDVVPPKPDGLNISSAAYNVPALAAAANHVVLLAYDEYDSNTGAGPLAGLDWDADLLADGGSAAFRSKLILGMPLYAGCWNGPAETTGGYAPTLAVALAAPGAAVDYDFSAQTPYVTYTGSDGSHWICYFEDAQSLALTLQLAHNRGLGGVAVWRLGFEDPGLWSLLGSGGHS